MPNRPFVELIGIKAQVNDCEEFESVHVREFKDHLQTDPAITEQIRPLVKLGFRFRWTGYTDPTGVECCLAIVRDEKAERKLRELVEGPLEEEGPDKRQLPLI
ncbi:hypothetical protein [Parasphingorhabdus halotolerans]|uniref:Uncharacterized protein n=1 Tax=Parasphingorhabdus halotolerans TaxID=2725558 RepID=A0A6H2DK26_9SPHN|nr:hypothetical protein [Parasphingorhabdus halotolerans]QJB68694.1 hypothetical protein HF685_04865 [Parasphingorhabdus halotolerans]